MLNTAAVADNLCHRPAADTGAGDLYPDITRQMLGEQGRFQTCAGDRAVEDIDKFTNVAWPGLGLEGIKKIR